jgi:hypothetical protein
MKKQHRVCITLISSEDLEQFPSRESGTSGRNVELVEQEL